MAITISLTEEQHENLIVGALEGGSNYWYWLDDTAIKIIKRATPGERHTSLCLRFWHALCKGAMIQINDKENPKSILGYISLSSIQTGEQIMGEKYPHHLADILKEEDDGTTADIWFQLAVMGKIVYG